jgi:PPOX class probable F420-dependent enzyme
MPVVPGGSVIMPAKLDTDIQAFLKEPHFACVATLMPDGSPQVTVTWVDTDGEHLFITTNDNSQKARNIRRDPRVAVCVYDQQNPYRVVRVRGKVVHFAPEGAFEQIRKVGKKYGRADIDTSRMGKQFLAKILPTKVTGTLSR